MASELRPHLVAVGDALADFVIGVGPATCERLGVGPGTAASRARAELDEALVELGGERVAASAGGSAANTCVAFAESGGRASLLTATMDDELGRAIGDDLTGRGVSLPLAPVRGGATGRCLVLVLPGGERAFLVWQGESWRLRALRDGMDAWFAGGAACDAVLVEGYLVATAGGMEVARSALAHAAALGARSVLALSDHRLVASQRPRFQALLGAGVDAVVGNVEEVTALCETDDVEAAGAALSRRGVVAAITLGDRGVLLHGPAGRHAAPARRVPAASTLGAGDAFAGGFLFGLLSGLAAPESLRLGQMRADAVLRARQACAPLDPWTPGRAAPALAARRTSA